MKGWLGKVFLILLAVFLGLVTLTKYLLPTVNKLSDKDFYFLCFIVILMLFSYVIRYFQKKLRRLKTK